MTNVIRFHILGCDMLDCGPRVNGSLAVNYPIAQSRTNMMRDSQPSPRPWISSLPGESQNHIWSYMSKSNHLEISGISPVSYLIPSFASWCCKYTKIFQHTTQVQSPKDLWACSSACACLATCILAHQSLAHPCSASCCMVLLNAF